jgi:hypothetical protein
MAAEPLGEWDPATNTSRTVLVLSDTAQGRRIAEFIGAFSGVEVVFASRCPQKEMLVSNLVTQFEIPKVTKAPTKPAPYWRCHERQLNGRRRR